MASSVRPLLRTTGNVCVIIDEQGRQASIRKYKHTALSSKSKIRLLKVEPPTQSWPLSPRSRHREFSFVEHELESGELERLDVSESRYVAVSYCWGDPVFNAPLVIVDQGHRSILPLTASAWEAVQSTLPAIDARGKLM